MDEVRDESHWAERLVPGKLMPGCSFPIGENRDHAFGKFQPLPLDGLSDEAKQSVVRSFAEVIEAVDQMHRFDFRYGRIRSAAMHNRGTATTPAATLWIDLEEARESGAVHAGDDEAMYWTEGRLASGAAPSDADDWYALGVVLAESVLTSSSVKKIWELSRQSGDFQGQLIANLRSVRSQRAAARAARDLISAASSGQVDSIFPSQLAGRLSGRAASNSPPLVLLVSLMALLAVSGLAGWAWLQKQRAEDAFADANEKLVAAEQALQSEREARPAPTTVIATAPLLPSTPAPPPADQTWWKAEIIDRPLEEAVAMAEVRGSELAMTWAETLNALYLARGQIQWRKHDPAFRRLVQACVNEPWEPGHVRDATERLHALNQAYVRWVSWTRSRYTLAELEQQHALMKSGPVKDFLGEWINEALQVRAFDLTVSRASGPESEWGNHLVGFETDTAKESKAWSWDTGATDSGVSDSIEFAVKDYRAGQELSFWLQQDGTIPYWNTTVLSHTFKEPLLVWRLGRGIRLAGKESGYAVTLTTNIRYGPPVVLAEADAKESQSAADRPVVDPLDSLPL